MRVLRLDEQRALALCEDDAGAHHTVEIALVDAGPGDQVLVHAGVALVAL
jgi:hydrogenase maturation factor